MLTLIDCGIYGVMDGYMDGYLHIYMDVIVYTCVSIYVLIDKLTNRSFQK